MRNTFQEKTQRKSKNILILILILFIPAIVLFLIPRMRKIGKIEVPNFIGQEIKTATQIAANKQLILFEQARLNNDTVPVGIILSQSPKKGTFLKKNDTIYVVVSKGRLTNVPRLIGFKKEEAVAELERVGLRLGRITKIYSETIPRDRIIATNPPPDDEIEKGSSVDLVISLGPKIVAPPPVPTSFIRPTFQFKFLEVKDPDRRGFNLTATFVVNNPNPIPAKIKGFYYKLEVDGHFLGSGTYYCDYSLNPERNTTVVINVNIRYDRIAKAAAELIQKGEVSYEVRGYYILEAEGGRSIEPVMIKGNFNIAEKLRPFLKSIFQKEEE